MTTYIYRLQKRLKGSDDEWGNNGCFSSVERAKKEIEIDKTIICRGLNRYEYRILRKEDLPWEVIEEGL